MMTWAALGTSSLRFLLVLPLVLSHFDAEDVAIWYLMATLMQVQYLFDLGFGFTTSRYFAYAMGGARDLRRPGEGDGRPNHELLGRLYATLRRVYLPLGATAGLLLGLLGTWMLRRPISLSATPDEAWFAWGIILVGSTLGFLGLAYTTYLQGTNRVALLRRWETGLNLGSILTSGAVLLAGGGLVALALSTQGWILAGVIVYGRLARQTERAAFAHATADREVLREIWRSAWRSGLGVLLNAGVVRLSAGVMAQFVAPGVLASYLVTFNVLDRLNQFAIAPFASKLPRLGALYSQGAATRLLTAASRSMAFTLSLFTVGAIILGLLATPLLRLAGSNTPFIGLVFWLLLAFAMLVHRYGAMHLQIYTLSNHVVWHIADGISGAIYLGMLFILLPHYSVSAVPIAMLVAYAGFYAPYALAKSRVLKQELVQSQLARETGGAS